MIYDALTGELAASPPSPLYDDTARTVTTYDEAGAVASTRPYTADENAASDAAVADAATLTDLAARVARIESHLWPEPTGPLPWVQPTGAHDAYSFGDQRTHNGRLWESTVAGIRTNTWAPGVFGWKDIGDTTGS